MTEINRPAFVGLPILALIIIVGLYLAHTSLIDPGADSLWRLHLAQGMLDGKVLYRDMIEVNPPLWFWAAIPAAAVGGYTGIVAINLVMGLLAVGLMLKLVEAGHDKAMAWTASIAMAIGVFILPIGDIGQREQAFFTACALWNAILAARVQDKALPLYLVLPATLFAAYGFALKHYFVLVPIATELALIAYKRSAYRPFRPETLGLALLAMVYAALVVTLTPDFLGSVLELVRTSYFGFGPFNSIGIGERYTRLASTCAFVIVPLIGLYLGKDNRPLTRLVMLSVLISVVVIVLQQKGWRYHLFAAYGLSILSMALMWSHVRATEQKGLSTRFMPLGLLVLLVTGFLQPGITNLRSNGQYLNPALARLIGEEPKDHHIAVLSTAPDHAFFPLARADRPHWSRHFSMWMMPGLLTPQTDPDLEARRLKQRAITLNEFRADLTCRPPHLIVGEVGYFRTPQVRKFDAMAILIEDPKFAGWLSAHYQAQPEVGTYPIWRLKGTMPASRDCS